MPRLLFRALLGLVCLSSAGVRAEVPAPTSLTPSAPAPLAGRRPDASTARAKPNDARFLALHEEFLARGRAGPIGVLFLGDSITEGWKKVPALWEQHFGAWQPANFGISGDATMGVLWRIENGELDGLQAKVVVLLLGTNNTSVHSAPEIAAAQAKIVGLIREKIPGVKVLLLGVFPRGPRFNNQGVADDHEPRMRIITALNPLLAQLDDGTHVRYLDLSAQFYGSDGKIPADLMPDQLHLSEAGYRRWAEAMQPLLTAMMQP